MMRSQSVSQTFISWPSQWIWKLAQIFKISSWCVLIVIPAPGLSVTPSAQVQHLTSTVLARLWGLEASLLVRENGWGLCAHTWSGHSVCGCRTVTEDSGMWGGTVPVSLCLPLDFLFFSPSSSQVPTQGCPEALGRVYHADGEPQIPRLSYDSWIILV